MESKLMKTKYSGESGFTLIEVLVAAVILTLGMLGFGSFLGNLVSKNAMNERRSLATTLAQEKIEELKNTAILGTLTAALGSPTIADEVLDKDGNATAGGMFTRNWVINAATTPKQINVTVSWVGNGISSVTLATLISDS